MPTSRRPPARPGLPANQVIGLIPHLFGSAPDGRVVLIGYLRTGPYSAYSLPLTPDLRQAAEPLIGHMHETGNRGVLAVAYDAALPAQAAADVIAETAGQSGVRLIDAVRAGPDRFWSCIRPGPSAGTAIQHPDPAAARSAARYSPGMGALAELTAPTADPRADAVTREALTQLGELTARKSAVQGIASTVRAMNVYQHGGRLVSGSQLTWLSVLLGEEWVRDDALARMDPRHSEAHRRLWLDVTLHARRGYRAAPATLLGYTSWQSGDRPMADIALKLAVSDHADNSLVRRLAAAIASGAPPAPPPMTPDEVSRYHARRLGLRPDAQWRRGAEPPEAG